MTRVSAIPILCCAAIVAGCHQSPPIPVGNPAPATAADPGSGGDNWTSGGYGSSGNYSSGYGTGLTYPNDPLSPGMLSPISLPPDLPPLPPMIEPVVAQPAEVAVPAAQRAEYE